MTSPKFSGRPFVATEANLPQLQQLKPNIAVLPWGATEGHNYHLPHGTDCIEATRLGETAVAQANAQGARCVLLPCIPFGNNNSQLYQVATITMRTSTQQIVLMDIADSLVRQGIDRLVILNFHGGNEFKPLIRDVMLAFPIFIVQANGYALAPPAMKLLDKPNGDHAGEFETSLMMHLNPEWVAPLEQAGDGAATPSKLPALTGTPGIWAPRDWQSLTKDTGVGDPRAATAAKGKQIFDMLVDALTPLLVQLSAAQNGDFPFVIPASKSTR
ncbi:MAG TPA: creatininase family protein [Tepidisphaeraceae bacterium]